MPKVPKRDLTLAERRKRRRKRKPCGSNLPKDVTNIAGLFNRTEGTKHNPFRLRVTWSKVTQTQANDDYKPDGYAIQLQGSPDGTTWDKENIRHKQVRGSAGKDGQWSTEDDKHPPLFVVFRAIKPKWYYRVRVRALSKDACDGEWPKDANGDAVWTTIGSATDDVAPSTPLNVRIFDASKGKRIVIDWDSPVESSDTDIPAEEVTFFQAQIFTNSAFTGTPYRFDKMQATSRVSFRIADADVGSTFYGRVRSIDAARNKSAWIPATTDGNSAANTTPSGATVGSDGASGGASEAPSALDNTPTVKRRVKALLVEWDDDQPNVAEPVIYEVHVTKTAGFTVSDKTRVGQTRGDSLLVTRWADASAGTKTLTNFVKADWQQDFYVKVRPKNIVDGVTQYGPISTISGAVHPARGPRAQIADGTPDAPINATATAVSPRRIMFRWDEPKDESVVRYAVEVYKRSSSSAGWSYEDTFYTRGRHYRHHIPKAEVSWLWKALIYSETAITDTISPAVNERQRISLTNFQVIPAQNEQQKITLTSFGSSDKYRLNLTLGMTLDTAITSATQTSFRVSESASPAIAIPATPFLIRVKTSSTVAEIMSVTARTLYSGSIYTYTVTRAQLGSTALTSASTGSAVYISSNDITYSAHNSSSTTTGSVRKAASDLFGSGNYDVLDLPTSGNPTSSQAYRIEFKGAYAGTNLPMVLYGAGGNSVEKEHGVGVSVLASAYQDASPGTSNPVYRLAWGGTTSSDITLAGHNGTGAGSVRAALNSIIGSGNYETTLKSSGTVAANEVYDITFIGAYGGTNVAQITSSNVTSGVSVGIQTVASGTPETSQEDRYRSSTAADTFTTSGDVSTVDFDSGGPTAAPTAPSGIEVKRLLRGFHIRWDDVQDDDTQEPVKYRVFIGAGQYPPDKAKAAGWKASAVGLKEWARVHHYCNGSALVKITKDHLSTAFYISIEARNKVGYAQTYAGPFYIKGTFGTQDRAPGGSGTVEEAEVGEIVANRFIADDGTGDRIEISDSTGDKAKVKFVGNNGSVVTFAASGGTVSVTGGRVDFNAGLTIPGGSAPNVQGSIAISGGRFWWRGDSGWNSTGSGGYQSGGQP